MPKVSLDNIYLDNKNPRHDPLENEREIIALLLKDEDVKPLARHIAMAGLSPLELIALAPHATVAGAYIPAEGNRRMCVLKLLADPDRADTESNRKYFRTLANEMATPITSIQAIVFPDKKTARPWVSLRHEGRQGGVGTKDWDSKQKARFNLQADKPSNPNMQALLLLDYAGTQHLLTAEQLRKVSITTLTRFLTNPVFRNALGLVSNRDLTISVPSAEFNHVVARFMLDSITPSSGVSSRATGPERQEYANKLRSEGDAPRTRGQPPIDAAAVVPAAPSSSSPKPVATGKKRNNRSRDNDKFVVPRNFKARIRNPILKRLYDELNELPADDFPFSAAFLTRAIIEQATTLYLRQKRATPPKELHMKLLALAELLQNEGMRTNELKTLRTMGSSKDDRGSADTLGAFVHGGAIPTKVDCIKVWDGMQGVLSKVFSELN